MYKNIGKKIRGLAAVIGWIGMILCVLVGVIMCIAMIAMDGDMVLVGIGCLLGGFVGAIFWWIGTWMMYGFGELIVKTSEVADNTRPTAPTYGGYAPAPGRAATAYGAPTFVPPAQPKPQAPQAAPQPKPQAPQAAPQGQAPQAAAQQGQCEFCKQTAYVTAAKVPGLNREYKLCPQCMRQHNATKA